jgi:hypothetical protein
LTASILFAVGAVFLVTAATAETGPPLYPILVALFVIALICLPVAVWHLAHESIEPQCKAKLWRQISLGGPFVAGWCLWRLPR